MAIAPDLGPPCWAAPSHATRLPLGWICSSDTCVPSDAGPRLNRMFTGIPESQGIAFSRVPEPPHTSPEEGAHLRTRRCLKTHGDRPRRRPGRWLLRGRVSKPTQRAPRGQSCQLPFLLQWNLLTKHTGNPSAYGLGTRPGHCGFPEKARC